MSSPHAPDSASPASSPSPLSPRSTALRGRGIVAALVLAPLHAAWLTYGEIVLGVTTASASLLPSVLSALFVLTLLNALIGRIAPRWKLNSAELVVCYATLTLSGTLTGFDFLQLLPHSLMFPLRFREVNPAWGTDAQTLPAWFRPTDPAIVKSFFEGKASFTDPAVWQAWAIPLCIWTLFSLVLVGTMFCLGVLVREGWFRQERLPFPLLELPLTLCEEPRRAVLYRSRWFWGAFAFVFLLLSCNALSGIFPLLPSVQLSLNNVGRDFAPPLSGAAPLYLSWQPFVFGLLFFVPLDVSFSAWFFFVGRKVLEIVGVMYGWRDPFAGASGGFPFVREIAQGAWLGLFLLLIWGGRRHLADVFRLAFPGKGQLPHRLYRFVVCGAGAGWAMLALFEWAAGMRLGLAVGYFGLFLISSLVMTRVFVQVGAPILELYFFNVEQFLLSVTGTQVLVGREAALLGQCYWFNHAYRQHPMGHTMAAVEAGQEVGISVPRIGGIVAGSVVIGVLVGLGVMIASYHTLGAASAKVNPAQLGVGGWETWNRILSWQSAPKSPQLPLLLYVAGGLLACLGLGQLGVAWLGSPFRPVGLAFAFSYALDYYWVLFLAVWAVKSLVLRYGGRRLYRDLTPLFLGMVLGDAVAQTLWGIVSAITGARGLSVYLPARF